MEVKLLIQHNEEIWERFTINHTHTHKKKKWCTTTHNPRKFTSLPSLTPLPFPSFTPSQPIVQPLILPLLSFFSSLTPCPLSFPQPPADSKALCRALAFRTKPMITIITHRIAYHKSTSTNRARKFCNFFCKNMIKKYNLM